MKKKVAVFAAALLASATISAHAIGIGVQGGWGWNTGYGASLLFSPNTAKQNLHFAFDWNIRSEGFQIGASGDIWALDLKITDVGSEGRFGFYLGPGAYVSVGVWEKLHLWAGARFPVGLDFKIQQFEIFLQAVPTLSLAIIPTFGIADWFGIGGNLGLRFWF